MSRDSIPTGAMGNAKFRSRLEHSVLLLLGLHFCRGGIANKNPKGSCQELENL